MCCYWLLSYGQQLYQITFWPHETSPDKCVYLQLKMLDGYIGKGVVRVNMNSYRRCLPCVLKFMKTTANWLAHRMTRLWWCNYACYPAFSNSTNNPAWLQCVLWYTQYTLWFTLKTTSGDWKHGNNWWLARTNSATRKYSKTSHMLIEFLPV